MREKTTPKINYKVTSYYVTSAARTMKRIIWPSGQKKITTFVILVYENVCVWVYVNGGEFTYCIAHKLCIVPLK